MFPMKFGFITSDAVLLGTNNAFVQFMNIMYDLKYVKQFNFPLEFARLYHRWGFTSIKLNETRQKDINEISPPVLRDHLKFYENNFSIRELYINCGELVLVKRS